jgi:hypothetical protein
MAEQMISNTVGTNTKKTTAIVQTSKTPREVFAENRIPLDKATVYLDGVTLNGVDMAASLDSLGANEGSILVAVTKMDNAA